MRIFKGIAVAALPAILAVFVFIYHVAMAEDVPRMSIGEFRGLMDDPAGVSILDVRVEKDWQAADAKIRGAFRKNSKEIADWSGDLDKTKTYVLYCA